jgi:hypothetical protein
MMTQANITVMGLWPSHSQEELMQQGALSPEQREAIESYQPVVDVNHWIFDARGRCINELMEPPPYFLSGLEIPRLKEKIRQSSARVILVAGGGPAYIPAIRAALKAGHLFTPDRNGVTSELARLLRQYGLQNVQTRAYELEYRAGTAEGQLFYEDMSRVFRTAVPFLRKWSRVPDDYETIYLQALSEMQQPDFVSTWGLLTAWGIKPVPKS